MLSFTSFAGFAQENKDAKAVINDQLEAWHKAATDTDFEMYFSLMTQDAVFIGTDAEENWQRDAFMAFAKPYFDKGKAWDFKTLERNIYFGGSQENPTTAWFDELLDTQMGICRGSGVVERIDGTWKIAHYVLSIAVPNEDVEALTKMKKKHDDNLIKQLSQANNSKE